MTDREIEVENRELRIVSDGRVRHSPVPEGFQPEMFRHIVAAVDLLYSRNGVIPTVKEVADSWAKFDRAVVARAMGTAEIKQALSLRGVEWDSKQGLTSEQMMALKILQNPADGRSTQAKLATVGISMARYRAWMRNPLFKQLMSEQAELNLGDAEQMALNRIISNAEAGDQKAAEKILEMTGRWNPQAQEVQNAKQVVLTVIEAVQKHVTDKDVLRSIMSEIEGKIQVMTITAGMKELGR